MNKNIQSVSDSFLCSNCGACSAICPKYAIDFKWSKIGRLYACVNDKCVDCGLCQKVCPSLDQPNLHTSFEDRFVGNISAVYIGKTTNEKFFQNAQSGGITTGILAYLFDTNKIEAAVVCKMEYGSTPQVCPIVVTTKEELYDTQKSCYTPVALLTILNQTSRYKSVAIVGLPCHIQGVAGLQKTSNKFNNIKYKIGLICDRTECAGIQEVIKDYTGFDKFIIRWRQKYDKSQGKFNYKSAPIVAVSEDGREMVIPRHYRLGLKEMFTPPRCRVCWDKINVFADMALGDPWRLRGTDAIRGESLIITRTPVGQSLICQLSEEKQIEIRESEIEAPICSQLIDTRRNSTLEYSSVFSVLNPSVDSYLYDKEEIVKPHNNASLKLIDFIRLDNADKESILKESKQNINAYLNTHNNKSIYLKLKSKIIKLFKKQ